MEFKWASRAAEPSIGKRGNSPEPPLLDQGWKGGDAHRWHWGIHWLGTCVLWSFLDLDGGSAGTSEALTAYLQERRDKESHQVVARVAARAPALCEGSKGCTQKRGVCPISPLRHDPFLESRGLCPCAWVCRTLESPAPPIITPSTHLGPKREVRGHAPALWVLHPCAHRGGLQSYRSHVTMSKQERENEAEAASFTNEPARLAVAAEERPFNWASSRRPK